MAATPAGTVLAWGANSSGQLGNASTTDSATPVQVRGLVGIKPVSPVKACYTYDGAGLRASKVVGETTSLFAYDVSSGMATVLSDGAECYAYGSGGLAVEQVDNAGVATYLSQGQLGSTRVLTDQAGKVVGTSTTAPTETWSPTPAVPQPLWASQVSIATPSPTCTG